MNSKQLKQKSKFLSLVLRHRPEKIGLTLDSHGWVDVDVLLKALKDNRNPIDIHDLITLVNENDKQRFTIRTEDGTERIRANQGHSISVDLELEEVEPLQPLYHGTVDKFIDSIKEDGLKKMSRQHVHLSVDIKTATTVGSRRGHPVILVIDAQTMYEHGHKFYVSENGVWLTDQVPAQYISKMGKL